MLSSIVTKILQQQKVFLALIFGLGLLGQGYLIAADKDYRVIRSDGFGYYYYLPSTFIFGNPTGANPINDHGTVMDESLLVSYGIGRVEKTGKFIDKYAIGVAISITPLFLAAHTLAPALGQAQTGYTPVYQVFAMLGGLFYATLGCFFLAKFLSKYVPVKYARATALAMFFGTNLYYYATRDAIFSHALSFCLITIFLYIIDRWYERVSWKNSVALGLTYGVILSTRQANALVIILFLLYGVFSLVTLKAQLKLFWQRRGYLLVILLMAIVGFAPQLLYWYAVTGSPIVYSYGQEGFNFLRPKLIQVLFFPSRNMFYWFPVNFFGFLGIYLTIKGLRGRKSNLLEAIGWSKLAPKVKNWVVALPLFLVLQVYLISSWWLWTFGGGFGHRALLDTLSVWALPTALGIFAFGRSQKRKLLPWLLVIAVLWTLLITFLGWRGTDIPQDLEAGSRTFVSNIIKRK